MFMHFFRVTLLFKFALVWTKEAELPLCPTNVLYFPQNLPMHCRMPTNVDSPGISGTLATVPQFYQSAPSDKHPPLPIPIPISPGATGPMPMPGPMAMTGQLPIPGAMAVPGPSGLIPFSGSVPLSSGPAQKLPVIVMPFYSPDRSFKKAEKPNYLQHSFKPRKWKIRHRRRRPVSYSSPDTDSSADMDTSSEGSSSTSSEYQGWWKGRRNHRRFNGPIRMKKRKRNQKRQLLTPVLQYVTKDGYVIFEKKISKGEAKDWLNVKRDGKAEVNTQVSPEARDMQSKETNDNESGEKEMAAEDNVELVTKRNAHRLHRLKAHRDKVTRKKLIERPI